VNAATGKVVWSTGLPEQVLGTPALDGAGVISVATIGYGSTATNADYLIDAATGAILATLSNGNSPQFAQPVFADGYLFAATETAGLIAYQLPGSAPNSATQGRARAIRHHRLRGRSADRSR
jgi:hypothetical protein